MGSDETRTTFTAPKTGVDLSVLHDSAFRRGLVRWREVIGEMRAGDVSEVSMRIREIVFHKQPDHELVSRVVAALTTATTRGTRILEEILGRSTEPETDKV